MADPQLNILDVKEHFLGHQGGALDTLDKYLAAGIKGAKNWHDHIIVLYHAARDATSRELYGADPERAARIIHKHVRDWSKKAIAFKGAPEPWALPSSLNAFSMLKTMPPSSYVNFCRERAINSIKRCDKRDTTEWMLALSHFTLRVDPVITEALCQRADMMAHMMSADDLYHLAHTMATLDAANEARYGADKPACVGKTFINIFNRTRIQNEMAFGKHTRYDLNKMADAKNWFGLRGAAYVTEPERNSGLEDRARRLFCKAGAVALSPTIIADTGHHIDLSFNFGGCMFDVEVDGPSHFNRSTEGQVITYDGPTIFQTLLMSKKDPAAKILRLPYRACELFENDPGIWRNLCEQIREGQPGAFMLDSEGKLTRDLLTRFRTSPAAAPAPVPVVAAPTACCAAVQQKPMPV